MSKLLNWIARRHWWLIGLLIVLFIFLENHETIWASLVSVHVFEYLIYVILLLVIGSLFDLLHQAIQVRSKVLAVIDYKHKLSQELSVHNDWHTLVNQMVMYPAKIAAVEKSALFIMDISNQFQLAAQWPLKDSQAVNWQSVEYFMKCLQEKNGPPLKFQQSEVKPSSGEGGLQAPVYHLPIVFQESLLGLLQITLKAGEPLTPEQQYIFENIGDELAFVLHAGQERRQYYEMTNSETALAERRKVSLYLHDHLGHNLGYLHFKLDDLANRKEQLTLEAVIGEFEPLRRAANEAYETVRGTLESIRPDTTPLLANLLLEHARKVAKRANLEIDFKTKGQPFDPPLETKRAIFYVFEEALSNIEKHARASKIEASFEWSEDAFTMIVSDNGVGYNVDLVNTSYHFGLDILRERIEKVNGQVKVTTVKNSGTTLWVQVPLAPIPGL